MTYYSPITLKRMVLMDSTIPYSVKQVYMAQIDAVDRPSGMTPGDLAGVGFGGVAGWLAGKGMDLGGVGKITTALIGGLVGRELLAPRVERNDYNAPNFRIPS